jgi:protein-disulfide isomerase
MRRYLPFAIIGAVFLIAIGSGLLLFRGKQSTSAPVAPIPPIVPAVSASPAVSVSPVLSVSPIAPAVQTPPAAATAPVPESASLHVRGGANAPVTIEEYGDFQCTPCAQLFPILAKVEEDYGEQLRVVFRHKPLRKHEHAVLAARAAEAAGLQGRFWEMHDLLFQNSLRWTKGVDGVGPDASPSGRLESKILAMEIEVRDVLAGYAERLKLDVERFKTDIDSEEVKARVDSDRASADKLGIDRTPTLYINGRLVPYLSITSAAALHVVIEAELNAQRQPTAAPDAQPRPSAQPK